MYNSSELSEISYEDKSLHYVIISFLGLFLNFHVEVFYCWKFCVIIDYYVI